MRVLITGATGFIGSALAARLASDGHEVVAVSRGCSGEGSTRHFSMDMAQTSPADWTAALDGVQAVVNCAGVFQSGAGDSAEGVHVRGANALFTACEERGVRRVIHISAAESSAKRRRLFQRPSAQANRRWWRGILTGSCCAPAL